MTYREMNAAIVASKAYDAEMRRNAEVALAAAKPAPTARQPDPRPGSRAWRELATAEWGALRRRDRQAAGPQAGTACGPLTDLGYCRNAAHTMGCAASMSTAASKAAYTLPGTPESERAWQLAAEERERMRARVQGLGPRVSAAAQAHTARVASDAATRKERAVEAQRVGSWVRNGMG